MREIKFRTWIKSRNRIENVVYLNMGTWIDIVVSNTENPVIKYATYNVPTSDVYLMQYTGLKDKNGKEIYEGDIVKYYQPYAKRWEICFVKFDTMLVAFALCKSLDSKYCHERNWVKIQKIEIIGNIYENPELLKEIV